MQGGVIFAIAKSQFDIQLSTLEGNYGFDASAVYGMANTDPNALKISKSVLRDNVASQNLVNLLLSEMMIEETVF